jgi:cob(I)alamin adenosyltransferase
MTTRIYTKTGDEGETGLFGGRRVSKDDVRVEAYGAVDELNSALGLVLSSAPPAEMTPLLNDLQGLLFELGAELSTPPEKPKSSGGLTPDDVSRLEARIDDFEAKMPELKTFVLPSGTPAAAALHFARGICRKAERAIVTLRRDQPKTTILSVTFMNRLGDLLFVLARFANHAAGIGDIPWIPRPKP